MIYRRSIICEPGIRQSVSQVSLKLIRDPLGLGLTPLQGCRGVKPTQAEAWAKFPRPFGPQAEPKSLG
jgi:hypothetical protein